MQSGTLFDGQGVSEITTILVPGRLSARTDLDHAWAQAASWARQIHWTT